jgi:hypothetical protein
MCAVFTNFPSLFGWIAETHEKSRMPLHLAFRLEGWRDSTRELGVFETVMVYRWQGGSWPISLDITAKAVCMTRACHESRNDSGDRPACGPECSGLREWVGHIVCTA